MRLSGFARLQDIGQSKENNAVSEVTKWTWACSLENVGHRHDFDGSQTMHKLWRRSRTPVLCQSHLQLWEFGDYLLLIEDVVLNADRKHKRDWRIPKRRSRSDEFLAQKLFDDHLHCVAPMSR